MNIWEKCQLINAEVQRLHEVLHRDFPGVDRIQLLAHRMIASLPFGAQ